MSLFKKKKTDDVPEAVYEEEKGDYAVKSNKALNRVMMVVALLAAFAIWFYVYTSTQTTDEVTFNLISISERNADTLASEYDLVVQSVNVDTVNVTLMGSRNSINNISSTDVRAYINLRGITTAGEYTLDVIVDVPEGVTVVGQTVSQVIVSVDTSTEKTFAVSGDSVILNAWSLENGYTFGDTTTNLKSVTLKGAAKNIEQIAGIGIRTAALGSVTSSLSSLCDIVLLDSQGNILDLPGVQIIPDSESIEAYIEVLKEKTVPLAVRTQYGKLSSLSISIVPGSVVIKGEASAVDGTNEIVIGTINEKEEFSLVYQKTFEVSSDRYTITDASGKAVSTAAVYVDLSGLPSRQVTDVPLYNGSKQIGTVSVNIVAINNNSMCSVMLGNISSNNIRAYSDKEITENSTIVIDIDPSYSNYLYEYGKAVIEQLYTDDPPVAGPGEAAGESDNA